MSRWCHRFATLSTWAQGPENVCQSETRSNKWLLCVLLCVRCRMGSTDTSVKEEVLCDLRITQTEVCVVFFFISKSVKV